MADTYVEGKVFRRDLGLKPTNGFGVGSHPRGAVESLYVFFDGSSDFAALAIIRFDQPTLPGG